jgi:NAD+ synthase
MGLRIAMAQLNATVGNLAGNAYAVQMALQQAAAQRADILVTPELFISGYPPEDLVLRSTFVESCMNAVRRLAAESKGMPAFLLGTPWRYRGKVYNAVVLAADGVLKAATFKKQLANYGVFEEKRVFSAGGWPKPLPFKGYQLGVPICEDIWSAGVSRVLLQRGARVLICLNASPYEQGKMTTRLNITAARSRETNLPLLYVNMVGGQDELVFDGRSFALHPNGQPALQLAAWKEEVRTMEWSGATGAMA